ncbi:UDP-glucose 4-epimerase family protein [Aeromonas veronii]|uniref:UDP-glucose 4-epimerase family protein n=1 Tax=Aeromonas veronii TaxID=654 RepID=UPI0007BC50B8|nr:SDR family oxidoreductase [Aeromonas veronii]KZW95465.1 UDP-glucose 4-epimerase [Aeromonas veronii]MBL0623808.1 SDR family oxidoreductase [Aeromonas veronii]MCF5884423.1 SDR family oxidoreductase [Aeromonas veronii]
MILLTGATGFVGNAVLKQLMQQPDVAVRTYGRRVPVLVNIDRVADARAQMISHVTGEISAAANYASALVDVDVVIHCAAQAHVMDNSANNGADIYRDINVDGTLHLARQAIAAGVRRFIFISSIKVNGESTCDSQPFTHNCAAAPEDAYGRSKQAAEDGLRKLATNSSMELVIIRPPLVYGPGVKGNFFSLLTIAKKNFPLPFGAINNQRSMVALANLVHLIITCIRHPNAANQTFLVSDDDDISTTELLEMMTRAVGKRPRLLTVPMSWLQFLGRMTGKQAVIERLCGNLQVDISHTKHTLGWQPPISVAEGIQRCFIEEE